MPEGVTKTNPPCTHTDDQGLSVKTSVKILSSPNQVDVDTVNHSSGHSDPYVLLQIISYTLLIVIQMKFIRFVQV